MNLKGKYLNPRKTITNKTNKQTNLAKSMYSPSSSVCMFVCLLACVFICLLACLFNLFACLSFLSENGGQIMNHRRAYRLMSLMKISKRVFSLVGTGMSMESWCANIKAVGSWCTVFFFFFFFNAFYTLDSYYLPRNG